MMGFRCLNLAYSHETWFLPSINQILLITVCEGQIDVTDKVLLGHSDIVGLESSLQ